jgi:hypothetical protein
MYKYLEPEVAGEIGTDTILDNSVHPPIVTFLHFHFTGWLGDDILETFPCFIMSERLKNSIEEKKIKGISFDFVKVTKSDDFVMTSINEHLPTFYWAKMNGSFGIDDFVIAKDFRLLVSDKAYEVICEFNITNALIEDY